MKPREQVFVILQRDLHPHNIIRITRVTQPSIHKQLLSPLVDKCVLYAFRCAVAYANDPAPDSSRYRWWYFTDKAAAAKE